MKSLLMLVLLAILPARAEVLTARVAVRSEVDVFRISKLDIMLLDARVHTRVKSDGTEGFSVRFNPENGFVTVQGSSDQLALLERRGFAVSHVHPLPAAVHENVRLDTIPFQFGWPRRIFNGLSLYENSPVAADMNGDGQLEISVTNAWGSYDPVNPPYLIVWRRSGAYLAGFPTPLQPGMFQSSADAGIAAIGDIAGDSKLEIVCGDENGYLYAFASNGQALPGFPVFYGQDKGVYAPAIADVNGDGKGEIAVISHDWDYPYAGAFLHLLTVTPAGAEELPGFPIDIQKGAENGPAIGDLEGDGTMEIVVATGGLADSTILARVIAFRSNGQVMDGFPWVVGENSAGNNPTLFDINGDGDLEILIRVKPDYTGINGIYAIDYTGSVLPGYPFPVTYGNPDANVAVGDMNGDGIPELAYGGVEAVDSGKVWVYDLGGQLLPGYPARVYRTWVDGSVAVADVDGDSLQDVVCGTNGVSNKPGLIRAFNNVGLEPVGFPLSPGSPMLNSFTTHPALVDIDGDGDTEIFAGRLDMYLYGWDTPGRYDSAAAWKMFKGNAARTGGQLRSPFAVSVREDVGLPLECGLMQNYPNPFNGETRIGYRVSGLGSGGLGSWDVRLVVYDVLGREVATLVDGPVVSGEHTVSFDASGLSSGVYIVRLTAGNRTAAEKMLLLR